MNYAPFALASAFDQYLGDPFNPQNAFSYARCATLDAQERFPDAICASLDQWGLPRYYVPEAFGGMLRDFEQPLQLIRMLARRDLTVAIGHGKTFLGAVCVWVGATAEQALQVAERVCGGAIVSWGLTERDHGSDLLHNDTCAEAHAEAGSGYRISGEKWLINNATRGELISVLARTLPEGGPRGFDMLLIDKAELEDGSLRYLPKEHTHGIRGADISGIAFDHARVSNDARIGSRGAGLEIVLKGLQLTRTLCASLSLGAADHALRLAVRFARERSLYGRTLAELPLARRTLIDAYADQLLAEAVALVGTRSIQALPADMSVTSAVVKYLVPTRTEAMLDTLADLMGARAFLVGVYADGMFQKVYRDNRIVSLFDGNTLVNLNAIVNEFQTIAKRYRRGAEAARTAIVFDLTAALPDFDRNALSLIARDGCGVVNALPALLESMDERAKREPELNSLTALTRWLVAAADDVHQQMLDSAPVRVRVPVEQFELAKRYVLCYAGAAVLGLWLHMADHVDASEVASIWREGRWLRVVLQRVLRELGHTVDFDEAAGEALWLALSYQYDNDRLFSLLPCGLAKGNGGAV
ncbi:acyl-CoA dehydrogenase family protein [Burkholderia singularis]|uniref:Acyl-CoA dehydrogenase, short-chain specific n=1 Tax=Burkholderia singularis TaxID=1503053 RepID=A0A238GZK0_9BURK|nr:acyl-CoA dehydrogenase [Burkholderia singularis]SMF98396.1 Acyl-CoA dehydrogenase, short-chain specific [Burkholderia singularis]